MTRAEIREAVIGALTQVVPDADPGTLDDGELLRDQLDIDSMDRLNFVIALAERTGLDIPESDYPALDTIAGCIDYIAAASA